MYNLQADLSAVTGVKPSSFNNLIKDINILINHYISQASCKGLDTVDINLTFGILQIIRVDDNTINYKFTPNYTFDSQLQNTFHTGEDMLKNKLLNKIENKLLATYKDLI